MDTTVRNPSQVKSRRRRVERRTAVSAPRVDRVLGVGTAVEPTPERTADARLGRAAVVGGLVGFVVMAAAVFVLALTAGAELAGAMWIAAFGAWWGGLGFGAMMGAIASSAREDHRAAHRTRHGSTRQA